MAAVLSTLEHETIYTTRELEEFLRKLKNMYGFEEDSIIYNVLKRLGKSFLETEDLLYAEDAVDKDDYEATHISLINDGRNLKIYVKTGGAGGHYAIINVKSSQDLDVTYSDHDKSRIDALVSFLRRAGVQFRREGNTVEFEWKRPPEELGRLLAGLTSLDLMYAYDALREAESVDDFIKRRIRYNT